jgi:hypothetical protein
LPVKVVRQVYLRERLEMQLKSLDILIGQGDKNAIKKKSVLLTRRILWSDPVLTDGDANLGLWQKHLEADWARAADIMIGSETLALQKELNRAIEAKLRIEQVLKDEKRRARTAVKADASTQTDVVAVPVEPAITPIAPVQVAREPRRPKRVAMRTVECSTEPYTLTPLATREWDKIATDLWCSVIGLILIVAGLVVACNVIGYVIK